MHHPLLSINILLVIFALSPIYSRRLRCPAVNLLNGRSQSKSRGRIMTYKCNRGFSMLGEPYAACIRGQWEPDPPVCLRRGCTPLPSLKNGFIAESMNRALLEFSCNPGYRLVGPPLIYCNGRRWNAMQPYCKAAEISCNFEDGHTCFWVAEFKNHEDDDFMWHVQSLEPAFRPLGTGPKHDHTLYPNDTGHYLIIETSDTGPSKEVLPARLFSPKFPVPVNNNTCFIFWYHMFGSTVGMLNIFLNNKLVFQEKENHGDRWIKGIVPLPMNATDLQLIIEGTHGQGYTGDIGLDDFHVGNSTQCDFVKVTSCEGRCGKSPLDTDTCTCTPECYIYSSCCADFKDFCGSESTTTSSSDSDDYDTDSTYSDDLDTISPQTEIDSLSDSPLPTVDTTDSSDFTSLNTRIATSTYQSLRPQASSKKPYTLPHDLLTKSDIKSTITTDPTFTKSQNTTNTNVTVGIVAKHENTISPILSTSTSTFVTRTRETPTLTSTETPLTTTLPSETHKSIGITTKLSTKLEPVINATRFKITTSNLKPISTIKTTTKPTEILITDKIQDSPNTSTILVSPKTSTTILSPKTSITIKSPKIAPSMPPKTTTTIVPSKTATSFIPTTITTIKPPKMTTITPTNSTTTVITTKTYTSVITPMTTKIYVPSKKTTALRIPKINITTLRPPKTLGTVRPLKSITTPPYVKTSKPTTVSLRNVTSWARSTKSSSMPNSTVIQKGNSTLNVDGNHRFKFTTITPSTTVDFFKGSKRTTLPVPQIVTKHKSFIQTSANLATSSKKAYISSTPPKIKTTPTFSIKNINFTTKSMLVTPKGNEDKTLSTGTTSIFITKWEHISIPQEKSPYKTEESHSISLKSFIIPVVSVMGVLFAGTILVCFACKRRSRLKYRNGSEGNVLYVSSEEMLDFSLARPNSF